MEPSPVLNLLSRPIPPLSDDGEPASFTDAWLQQQIPDHVEWTVCFRLAIQEGQPVISELRVIPSEEMWEDPGRWGYDPGEWSINEGSVAGVPPGGISSQLVRSIPFVALDALPDIIGWVATNFPEGADDLGEAGLVVGVAGKRPGPKGPSDYELALLAQQYVEQCATGNPHPINTLTKEYPLSGAAMRDRLVRARDKGLLTTPPKRGKAGGHLTKRAIALIEDAKKEAEI
jgi:hypothetical protein